jgi:hypothetical protein
LELLCGVVRLVYQSLLYLSLLLLLVLHVLLVLLMLLVGRNSQKSVPWYISCVKSLRESF